MFGLSALRDGSSPTFVPPRGFRPAGGVLAAWSEVGGPFGPASSRCGTSAQRAGLRYERKILSLLSKECKTLLPQPWYRYRNERGTFYCRPDAVLLFERSAIIFEVKLRWNVDGWWQLRHLYEPVVRVAHKLERVTPVLVCRHFDGAVRGPEEPRVLSTLKEALREGEEFMILPWRV